LYRTFSFAYLEQLVLLRNSEGINDLKLLIVKLEETQEKMESRVNCLHQLYEMTKASTETNELITMLEKLFLFSKTFASDMSLFLKQFIT